MGLLVIPFVLLVVAFGIVAALALAKVVALNIRSEKAKLAERRAAEPPGST